MNLIDGLLIALSLHTGCCTGEQAAVMRARAGVEVNDSVV
jgi:hypothetical protein